MACVRRDKEVCPVHVGDSSSIGDAETKVSKKRSSTAVRFLVYVLQRRADFKDSRCLGTTTTWTLSGGGVYRSPCEAWCSAGVGESRSEVLEVVLAVCGRAPDAPLRRPVGDLYLPVVDDLRRRRQDGSAPAAMDDARR